MNPPVRVWRATMKALVAAVVPRAPVITTVVIVRRIFVV